MSQGPKLLIFDCDGVLVDSEVLAVRAEVRVLAEVGFPMTTEEIVDTCVGLSYPAMMRLLEERFGKPVPDGLEKRIQEEATALFPTELVEIEGMGSFLEADGRERCVASSGTPDRIALSLGITGLDRAFRPDAIFSATMVLQGKPAPDLFLHAAEQMGFTPGDCIVVEDSPHGIAAAQAADMAVVGVTAGGHVGVGMLDRIRAANPTRIAASVTELASALDELSGP